MSTTELMQSRPGEQAALREGIRQQIRDGIEQGRLAAQAAVAEAQMAVDAQAVTTQEREVIVVQPPGPPGPPPIQPEFGTTVPTRFETPEVPTGAVVISLAFFAAVVLLVLLMPIMRAVGRRAERRNEVAIADPEAKQQLRDLSHAVEAIAIEVERLSAGQRDVTRSLSERAPAAHALVEADPARAQPR